MCAKILNQLINLASLLALLLTSSPLVMSDGHQKVEEKKSKEDKNNKENPVILDEIEVIADRAMDRKTPITFSDVSKEELLCYSMLLRVFMLLVRVEVPAILESTFVASIKEIRPL